MLEILSFKNTVQFLKYAKVISMVSMLFVFGSIISLAIQRLNWGLDFTGGTVIEVEFNDDADLEAIRSAAKDRSLQGFVVQRFGTTKDVVFRLPISEDFTSDAQTQSLKNVVYSLDDKAEIKRIEFVGPAVGQELAEQGGLAVLVALVCIMIYVSFRFEWRLALGSVAALLHDVLLTLGIFSILHIEFDLTVLAGVLTVVGYSLNDTIVVFDRIRENFIKMRKGTSEEVVNVSVTQTMSRTVITTITTLFVVIALFSQGGEMIHGFATALLLGIMVGTYSSIYVASFVAIRLGICREHMLPTQVEKEGSDQEDLLY